MPSSDLPNLDGEDPLELLAAFVSARLVENDDAQLGALAFDPNHDGDELADGRTVTGWEIFVGDETEEELSDAERVRLPSLSWVVERFPAVVRVLEGHDGSEASWVADEDGTLAPWNGDDA